MRFHNSNDMTCGGEKRVKGKLVKSSRCYEYYEKENLMHALTEITLKFYCFTLCHTSSLFCFWSSQPVFYTCFCKCYARCNGKINCRLVLSLEISRDRDKLLTVPVPSQFSCIISLNSVLDVRSYILRFMTMYCWGMKNK